MLMGPAKKSSLPNHSRCSCLVTMVISSVQAASFSCEAYRNTSCPSPDIMSQNRRTFWVYAHGEYRFVVCVCGRLTT